MSNQPPPTETMKISEVKQQLNRLVNQVFRGDRRILVEKSGIPVVGLVSAADLRRLQELDRAWDERTRAIERFSEAFADVSTEEAEAEGERIIAKQRERRRYEAERRTA
jgi:prevent-host-death family protein